MASAFLTKGLSAACVCLALCVGAGPAQAFAQQAPPPDQQQDQQQNSGPSQYPQQPPQGSQPAPQDQAPSQYPQDQGAAPYPDSQQAPQDQTSGAPQPGGTNFAPQGPQMSPSDVARISFVQGDVKMTSSGRTDFQQAVSNMPLLANTSLQTGQDGEAEVEFADGSVARVTPNSSVALEQIGQDSVVMQQNSGLVYYELNVGQGHPAFRVEFPNAEVAPTDNAIFRMDLDGTPEVAVMTGSVGVSSNGSAPATVNENQTLRFQSSDGAPYTIAQNITSDSWDQWNQDRDQAISEEAAQQTSVRDQAGDTGDENWNDLDAYGNWYPVQGSQVWVPGGVSAGWDPYGYGYWGYYSGLGYTYISGYPWGWLPYHCGAWNYYPFGWGWAPGGCGRGWYAVGGIHGYRGYLPPRRPAFGAGLGVAPLVAVNRGALARGPWGAGHPLPAINHDAALNFGGHSIAPLSRAPFHAQAVGGARGTSPGVRTALRNPGQADRPFAATQSRSSSRSTYTQRSTPTPHYSASPGEHFSYSGRSGGGRGR